MWSDFWRNLRFSTPEQCQSRQKVGGLTKIFNWATVALHIMIIELCFSGYSIQCYQCDSNEDETCPAHRPFDRNVNAIVNCGGFEAKIPGTFCMKIYQESPGCKFYWRGMSSKILNVMLCINNGQKFHVFELNGEKWFEQKYQTCQSTRRKPCQ
jgi:hypothetical protein